jgi:FkbM family methyltransferase
MLIPLNKLFEKYNISISGILHVGAHECEELNEYEKYLDRSKILWIDAMQQKVDISKNKYNNILIEQAVVSDTVEVITFNVANNGQSSSILELGLHKQFHPEVHYIGSFKQETKLLKDIICKYDIPFNFINLDIQGAELKALKGMSDYLHNIEYIYTEVNCDYVYEKCALIDEIDEYLQKYGLYRVETKWWGDCKWGDAFYIRKQHYISLCIPTKNRFDNFLVKYLDSYIQYLKDGLINEIIISDETGNDYDKIMQKYGDYITTHDNFKVYKNKEILGVFKNKLRVCSYASNNYIALIDSDNFCDDIYFKTIYKYIIDNSLSEYCILAPSFAKPGFNYTHLNNQIITTQNIHNFLPKPLSFTCLNTGNFVLTKTITDNITYDSSIMNKISSCDVVFFNLLAFQQFSNFQFHVVKNLEYIHVVHPDSEYLKTHLNCDDYNEKYITPAYHNLGNYIFFPKLDYMNNDMFFSRGSVENSIQVADNNKFCAGFNTLGYFKTDIDVTKLVTSCYFGEKDGIYIKKEYLDKKKEKKEREPNKEGIYICGCVKNCNKYLIDVFKNIDKMITLFPTNYKVIIAYDASTDGSYETLVELQKTYNIEIIMNNNKCAYNTNNISNARNSIIQFIKTDNQYEYFIMMDMDDVCSKPINLDILAKYLKLDDTWDSLSFNIPEYYDIWALSIDAFVYSCWHWNSQVYGEIPTKMKNYVTEKLNNLKENELLDCYSAFNGFSIYKTNKFIDCEYKWNINDNFEFISKEMLQQNNNSLQQTPILNSNSKLEDCEHRYFHFQAKYKNNARIKISPLYLFDENKEKTQKENKTKEENIDKYVNEDKDESLCQLVCSRGLLKSCDFYSQNPISGSPNDNLYLLNMLKSVKMFNGMSIYVCNELLHFFINNILIKLVHKFVLVSGDSDMEIPNDVISSQQYNTLINSPLLLKWFIQNTRVQDSNKIVQMPIGLDYHTISSNPNHPWKTSGESHLPKSQEDTLMNIKNGAPAFQERIPKIYMNFTIQNDRYNQRKQAFQQIPQDLMEINQTFTPRTQNWQNIAKYAFVLSPFGNGMDCHRTWEVLCLGSIPIVCAPKFTKLFEDLPVLNVNDWSEITEELLNKTIQEFSKKSFNYDKLSLSYWTKQFSLSNINIVLSRYKKEVDWVYKLGDICNVKILIYDKETPTNKLNVPVNKGNEASAYLKYIIDNYEQLPEYTFFIHDEEYSWHHSGKMIDKFKEAIDSNKLYYSINDKCVLGSIINNELYPNICEWYKEFIEEYIPIDCLPNKDWTLNYRGSAQFLVNKSLITNLPKKFYENLYKWIITTDINSYITSRFMEWTWHIFWDIYPNLNNLQGCK